MTLRSARRAAGLTQAELAERVKVSQTTISQLEDGRISGVRSAHETVVRIARVLGVDPQSIDEFRVNGNGGSK